MAQTRERVEYFSGADSLFPTDKLSKDGRELKLLLDILRDNAITPAELEMDSYDDLVVIGGDGNNADILTTRCGSSSSCDTAPVWVVWPGEHENYGSFKDYIQAQIDIMKNR